MQKRVSILTLAFLLLVSTPAAFARENTEVEGAGKSAAQRLSERKAELAEKVVEERAKASRIKEKRDDRIEQGCEKIEAKIVEVLGRHETAKEKHLANQNRLYTRGKELATKLTARGADTAKLTADLETFKGKLDTVTSTFNAYNASLTATQQYSCGESEGAFKEQLRLSRDDFKAFKDAISEARDYWKAVVMADITAIKEQLAASASPTPSASSSASESN